MKQTAVLLISCPDKKGIVAGVANFLYKHNANILHADEHQDAEQKLFFQRVEWDLDGFKLTEKEFAKQFSALANKFGMDYQLIYATKPKVAILVSKEDHCLVDLLYRYKSEELQCDIPIVISNYSNSKALTEFYNIEYQEIPANKETKLKSEQTILSLLKKHDIDFVILARYMRILSPEFLNNFKKPIINIHHSFLPSFIGGNPYHQAFERGVKLIGATSHYVTAELDQGPIIEQDVVRVSHRDTVKDLIQKGRDIERIVLSRAVKWHIENKILVYNNKTVVFD